METTIFKTVKGSTMEAIFDNSETANVKYFKAIAPHDSGYNPEEKYKYEITIRHPENTDANVLFEEARFKAEILKPNLRLGIANSRGRKPVITALKRAYNNLSDLQVEINPCEGKDEFKKALSILLNIINDNN